MGRGVKEKEKEEKEMEMEMEMEMETAGAYVQPMLSIEPARGVPKREQAGGFQPPATVG